MMKCTTMDIFNLHLRASLVTLSACQTGRNVLGGGDELLHRLPRRVLGHGQRELQAHRLHFHRVRLHHHVRRKRGEGEEEHHRCQAVDAGRHAADERFPDLRRRLLDALLGVGGVDPGGASGPAGSTGPGAGSPLVGGRPDRR